MPVDLAVETSVRCGSVALVVDGVVSATERIFPGHAHAAGLVPQISRMLSAAGVTPAHVGRIFVSVGPGSFTGLRLGVTFAKVFAFTTGARLVAVPTMQVIAERAPRGAETVLVVSDARRGLVYAGQFRRQHPDHPEPRISGPVSLMTLADALKSCPGPAFVLHDELPAPAMQELAAAGHVTLIGPPASLPDAEGVASVGARMAERGEFVSADELLPLYLRLTEAEEKLAAGRLSVLKGRTTPPTEPPR